MISSLGITTCLVYVHYVDIVDMIMAPFMVVMIVLVLIYIQYDIDNIMVLVSRINNHYRR